jgi:hypothetical protein
MRQAGAVVLVGVSVDRRGAMAHLNAANTGVAIVTCGCQTQTYQSPLTHLHNTRYTKPQNRKSSRIAKAERAHVPEAEERDRQILPMTAARFAPGASRGIRLAPFAPGAIHPPATFPSICNAGAPPRLRRPLQPTYPPPHAPPALHIAATPLENSGRGAGNVSERLPSGLWAGRGGSAAAADASGLRPANGAVAG